MGLPSAEGTHYSHAKTDPEYPLLDSSKLIASVIMPVWVCGVYLAGSTTSLRNEKSISV